MNAAIRILKQYEIITQNMVNTWSKHSKQEYKEAWKNASNELKEIKNALEKLEK